MKAWLFRILRNAFIDQRRREARSPVRQAFEVDFDIAAGSGDVVDQIRNVEAKDVDAAVRELSEEHRSVVLLDIEGFSEQEIADVMGCAPGTVKSRLSRARSALRVRLQEYAR